MSIKVLFDASALISDVFVYVMSDCPLTRRGSRAGVLENLRMRVQEDVAPRLCWGIHSRVGELIAALLVCTNVFSLFARLVHFARLTTLYSVKGHHLSVKQVGVLSFHLHVDVFGQDGESLSQCSEVFLVFQDILSIQMNFISLLTEFEVGIALIPGSELF